MTLTDKVDKMMSYASLNAEAMEQFIEHLTFAPKKEICELIKHVISKYGVEFPFWALLLSYRLAILQDGQDTRLLKEAGNNIGAYGGPDYDFIARNYLERAEEIESQSTK